MVGVPANVGRFPWAGVMDGGPILRSQGTNKLTASLLNLKTIMYVGPLGSSRIIIRTKITLIPLKSRGQIFLIETVPRTAEKLKILCLLRQGGPSTLVDQKHQ